MPVHRDADREPDRARFRLFDSVASLLLRAAADRPLCVVLDDLQWADAASLLLLGFLARQLSTSGLLVIGCYRDTEIGARHPLRTLRGDIGAGTEVVELRGLDQREVAQLIADVGGVEVGDDLVADVFRRTAGNPFFVREIVRLMAGRGTLHQARGQTAGVPDGVRQVVESRLARLPQACATLLAAAAVMGQTITGAVLARPRGVRRSAGHYGRAMDSLGGAGLLNEAARLELSLGRADALRRAGDVTSARADYRRASAAARSSGQASWLARAALGVQALGVESGASRVGCIDLLEEALSLLPDEGTVLKAQVMASLAREVYLARVDG